MSTVVTAALCSMRDTGQTVADPIQDIRGRHVRDPDGVDIGKVRDLLVDKDSNAVRMLRVDRGGLLGFAATSTFVPVDAVARVADANVYLRSPSETVESSPAYNPELADTPEIADLYTYYGHPMMWTPQYIQARKSA